ncbi:hypothetical protein NIES267_58960 [Calothrix parasitica NIES-267]|uniref:Uncharacterized protein n=1 Tax=Calothrix parasitica NIES-267 TaxID=1973488 RepID=A0A1Z4LYR9_9CYAN|nr:hypothetical protein NIES267_58960 [Calothrix parasitica NIES-267]
MLLVYKSLLSIFNIATQLIVLSITTISYNNLSKYEKKAEKLLNQIFQAITSSNNNIDACL